MKENDFLHWLPSVLPSHARVPLHVGDDMAIVIPTPDAPPILLKTDQCLDRVHVDTRVHTAVQIGRKAVNRCLSDCAAMACLPTAMMIAVALPKEEMGWGDLDAFAKELLLACRDAGNAFDCPLVGGDTAIWAGPLTITVSLVGRSSPFGPPVPRSGAKPGDTLFVSGSLGGAYNAKTQMGRHLTFTPRIALAQALLKAAGSGLHAMMDLSDGLAQDVPRLCRASNAGAHLYPNRLPISPDAWTLSESDGLPAGLHALADGEDYELLFALDPAAVPEIVNLTEIPLTAIGTLTEQPTLALVDENGKPHPFPKLGFEHKS